jgi:hypothetical protein
MENMLNWLEALPYTKCGLDGGGKHMLGKCCLITLKQWEQVFSLRKGGGVRG